MEFADQQGGDEIPRQAEEHGHTDEAVDERPSRGVLAEDQKNCYGTDAIQFGTVALVAHKPTLVVLAVRLAAWARTWQDALAVAERIWPRPDAFDQAEHVERARIARHGTAAVKRAKT